jgi:hypothetical protein
MNNKNTSRTYSARIFKILASATLLILFMHLLLQYLNLEIFHQQNGPIYELSNRFDLDDESSVPTWFSQGLFLSIGFLALLAAYLSPKVAVRRLWLLIGSIGLIFSIDEIATLHEFVLQMLHVLFFQEASPTNSDNAWLIVAPFVLIAALIFARKIWSLLPRRTVVLLIAGGGVFLIGAIAVDLMISIGARETFLNQGILVAIEETLELFGTIVVVYAVLDYLETTHRKALMNAREQLRNKK